jgi:cytochrome P450
MSGGHWLFGNAREFRAAPHRYPAELGWKSGGVGPFRILHKSLVAITDPQCAWQVLVGHQERYERSHEFRNHSILVGDGLISTEGEPWLKRRRQTLPAFLPERLKRIVPATCAATRDLLVRWEAVRRSGDPVPIVADMQRLAMNVIGRALLSTDLQAEDAVRFGKALRDSLWFIRERNNSIVNVPLSIPTRGNRRLRETRLILDTYIGRHLREREGGARSEDMLDALFQAGLAPQALLDETKTLFLTGSETTATALAWALHLLARHPHVAEQCREEAASVLKGTDPQWEDLEKLKWTEQIANETLRLYPPVHSTPRRCIVEDVLKDYVIRRGTIAVISIFGIHRAEKLWNNPHGFQPERFETEPVANTFLPFGLGKHTCIGNTFAMVEMKLILAMILQRYRLEPADNNPVGERPQVTLLPSREIPIHLIAP